MNLSEYYNTVMELSHGIVITLDEKGRIIHGNSRFEAVSGFEIGQLAGRDWFESCVDAKRRDQARVLFADIVTAGNMGFMKGSLRARDGRRAVAVLMVFLPRSIENSGCGWGAHSQLLRAPWVAPQGAAGS